MNKLQIAISWVDPVEKIFVEKLSTSLKKTGIELVEITYINFLESFEKLKNKNSSIDILIDRASLDNPVFCTLANLAKTKGTKVLNDPDIVARYSSKKDIYMLLKQLDIEVPKAVFANQERFVANIEDFNKPLVAKQSYGGGGDNVLLNARAKQNIVDHMKDNYQDDYMIHPFIVPDNLSGRAAWFRVFYIMGEVIPTWWNPTSHFYLEFNDSDLENAFATELVNNTRKIGEKTELDMFSTEFVLSEGKLVAIDYINQPIDLNTQEYAPDGLPVSVLDQIVKILISKLISATDPKIDG